MAQNVSESSLTRDELIALRNKRTGMTIFQASWILVFVCLFVVNMTIRGNFVVWPPEGVERLNPILPIIASVLLLVSGWTVNRAFVAIQRDELPQFHTQWWTTLLLGFAFLVGMGAHWVAVNDAGQYGQISRVMIAYHALHAVAILAYMWRVERRARAGLIDSRDTWSVEAGVKLWYFVIIAWIIFFIALYVL